jgi:hypothetical protein
MVAAFVSRMDSMTNLSVEIQYRYRDLCSTNVEPNILFTVA